MAVGRDGQGLREAWRQQIQQFKNVSAEVANTILAVYPSPVALHQAYTQCTSEKEAELLLQNLEVCIFSLGEWFHLVSVGAHAIYQSTNA